MGEPLTDALGNYVKDKKLGFAKAVVLTLAALGSVAVQLLFKVGVI